MLLAEQRLRQSGVWQSPKKVAHLALLLVSDKASAITGQTIGIEGGAGLGIHY